MGILEGRTILVTGVTHTSSIAYQVAKIAQEQGARVVISNFGRAMSLTNRVVKSLDPVPPVIELDVTNQEHLDGLADTLRAQGVTRLDGVVHSIAFANPETAMGGKFLATPWEDVATAIQVSAFSLKSLTVACQPLFGDEASVVGLTFDGRWAWPVYDWMGVAKGALESTARDLARFLGPQGVRVNIVSAGPLDTIAKKAIPGSETFNDTWDQHAPLGWNTKDAVPTAKAVVALLSDWFPKTTGEMVHVDGGVHAMGV